MLTSTGRLKRILFDEYGGFADKRIKRLEKGNRFIIDDRDDGDVGADRQLLSYFCMMFAEVLTDSEIRVSLYGNVPQNESVREWMEANDCEARLESSQGSATFVVEMGQQSMLSELADKIESIVARGAPRYSVRSYKYVCPRTADSLRRLEETLDRAWDERRGLPNRAR